MDVRRESILANTPPVGRDIQVLYTQRIVPPPVSVQQRILDWKGATNISKVLPPDSRNSRANTSGWVPQDTDSNRAFSNCRSGYWRNVPTGATTQRVVDGKFLDSDNGDCSAVVAEYDEQKEREIAEAIFDWWISKKSFKQWFAEKYQQGTLDFGEDNE